MSDTVNIPTEMFHRMTRALIGVEEFLKVRKEATAEWVSEETALQLLGCSRAKLYKIKAGKEIKYKSVGRAHQYCKKSIDKYNELNSRYYKI